MKKFLAAKADPKVVKQVEEVDNILGIGIGPKEVGEKPTDKMALKFFVKTKRDRTIFAGRAMVTTHDTIEGVGATV